MDTDHLGNVNNLAEKDFSMGVGLPSMGRWDIDKRIWNKSDFWLEVRKETLDMVLQHLGDERKLDRACFEMAVKGEQGCDIVCDEGLKDSIRKLWVSNMAVPKRIWNFELLASPFI